MTDDMNTPCPETNNPIENPQKIESNNPFEMPRGAASAPVENAAPAGEPAQNIGSEPTPFSVPQNCGSTPTNSQYLDSDSGKTSAIVGLVLGIVGIVFAFIVPFIGIICGIIGLVFSNKAKKEGFTEGLTKGGMITSIIALVLSVVMIIVSVAIVGFAIASML